MAADQSERPQQPANSADGAVAEPPATNQEPQEPAVPAEPAADGPAGNQAQQPAEPPLPPPAAPPPPGDPAADFTFVSRGGFDANFALTAAIGYQPSAAERAYMEQLDACIARVSDIRLRDPTQEDPDLQAQKEGVRDRAVRELRSGADGRGGAEKVVRQERGSVRDAAANAERIETYRIEGRYREWLLRINTVPFTVRAQAQPDNGSNIAICGSARATSASPTIKAA